MNPTDCLEIITIVDDVKKAQRIFELIEQNYGRNAVKEIPEHKYSMKII